MKTFLALLAPFVCSVGAHPVPASAPLPPARAHARTSEALMTLIHGGRIYHDSSGERWSEALLVRSGRVVALGTKEELMGRAGSDRWRKVDLGGQFAYPGFQDANGKLAELGFQLQTLDLRGTRSFEELIDRVAEAATGVEPGEWIIGRGWDHNMWVERAWPSHRELSARVRQHPVYLISADGTTALCNHEALRRVKLHEQLEPPPRVVHGRLPLDGEHRAKGVLVGKAKDFMAREIPRISRSEREQMILIAQDELLSKGITCVHEISMSLDDLSILVELRERRKLHLRVVAYIEANERLRTDEMERIRIDSDLLDRLTVAGIGLTLDGSLGSWTAALLDPYADNAGEVGTLLLNENDLVWRAAQAVELGFQPAISATGDRANRLLAGVLEKVQIALPHSKQLRPRIEGGQVVASRDWVRMAAIEAVPCMKPLQSRRDLPLMEERLGRVRSGAAYAWRYLALGLVQPAFGSGFPANDHNPLMSLHAAQSRQGNAVTATVGDQSLTASDALAGFTDGAAYAARQEDRRGRLRPGYFADLSVFDLDLLHCEPSELLEGRCTMTVVNGEVAWRADQ